MSRRAGTVRELAVCALTVEKRPTVAKAQQNGNDLRKWYITKFRGAWLVMPPVIAEISNWHTLGATFTTGPEAHAAFARGGQR